MIPGPDAPEQEGGRRTTGTIAAGAHHRLVWLDGLRGIAAAAVVFGHYVWSGLGAPVRAVFDPGVWGVGVFFLISGFIVPQSVRLDRSCPLGRFLVSRVFRLYPAYWLSLAVGVAVFGATTAHALVNATMLQRFVGVPDVIGVYWTLQIEALFYGFVAFTLLIHRFNDPALVRGGAIASALGAVGCGLIRDLLGHKAPIAVPIGLSFILCGHALALTRAGLLSRGGAGRLFAVVAPLIGLACLLGYDRDWGYGETPVRFLVSYTLAVGAFALAYRCRGRTVPLAAAIGAISYPVYLLHQPVHVLLGTLMKGASPAFVTVAAAVAVLGLATAVHVLVERPAIELGRSLWPRGPAAPSGVQRPRIRSITGAWFSRPTRTVPPSTLPISTGTRKLTT